MFFKKRKGKITKKWDFNTESTLLAGPAVYDVDKDGKKEIVIGTKDGRVIMFDEEGKVRWTYNIRNKVSEVDEYFQDAEAANSINGSPVIADINNDGQNEIIFGTEDGLLYAIDSSGVFLWKYKVGDAIRSSVLLHDFNKDDMHEIIFGSTDGNLYVVSANGELIWKHEGHSPIESTPINIPHTNEVVFGCDDGTIKCVGLKEGAVWSYQTNGKISAQAVISDLYNDNRMFVVVGSSDFSLYVLTETGELTWKYPTEGAIVSKAKIVDLNGDGKKEIIFGSCDNSIYTLTNKGDLIWSYETYFWVAASPIVEDIDNDGKLEVVVGSYDHNIYVLEAEGSYELDYVPGLGGVLHQTGNYSEVMTMEPGRVEGKKIWQYQTPGIIVGCSMGQNKQSIIVNIKDGQVNDLVHQK